MHTLFPTLPPRTPFAIGQKPKETKLSCYPQKEGAHTCCGAGLFALPLLHMNFELEKGRPMSDIAEERMFSTIRSSSKSQANYNIS